MQPAKELRETVDLVVVRPRGNARASVCKPPSQEAASGINRDPAIASVRMILSPSGRIAIGHLHVRRDRRPGPGAGWPRNLRDPCRGKEDRRLLVRRNR